MLKTTLFLTLVCCVGFAFGVQAQAPDATALAAALDKNKYKKKDKVKNGVDLSVEVYVDIKNEPAVRQPSAYSGRYADEYGGFSLDLKVAADGTAEASGVDTINGDPQGSRISFTLKNARVTGAVLTADKVFANGQTERLEAVFVNRTTLNGKNANQIESRETQFGLGFIQANGKWTNRVFL